MLSLIAAAFLALGWNAFTPWPTLLFGVAIIWFGERNASLKPYAPWLSVIAATTSFLWPATTALLSLEQFFLACLCLYAVGLVLSNLGTGLWWSWFVPLALLLLQPSAFGVLGGLALLFLSSLQWRMQRHTSLRLNVNALLFFGIALLLLATIGFLLPKSSWRDFGVGNKASAVAANQVQPQKPKQQKPEIVNSAKSRFDVDVQSIGAVEFGTQMMTLAICALLIVYALRLKQIHGKEKTDWAGLIPLISMGILYVAIAVYGFLSSNGNAGFLGAGKSTGHANVVAPRAEAIKNIAKTQPVGNIHLLNWINIVLTLIAIVMLAYAFWLLRLRQPNQNKIILATEKTEQSNSPNEKATNKVRQIYKQFLMATTNVGLARAESETPQQFAGRVSVEFKTVKASILELTNLYEPVRYGNLATDAGANQADLALQKILASIKNSGVNL